LIETKTAYLLSNARRFQDALAREKTKEEALENITDAIKLCLDVRSEKGMP